MRPAITPQRFSAFDTMSSADVQALLSGARSDAPSAGPALKYRHVAVLCEAALRESAQALAFAASALGATVVQLNPVALGLDDRLRLRQTARLLGRLYCLICSEGLGVTVNAGLSRWAGVPLLTDVTEPAHPTRILADLMVMQEHAQRAAETITLGLNNSLDAGILRAWQHASGLTGLRIVRFSATLAAQAPAACDFYFGGGPPCAPGQLPHLIATDVHATSSYGCLSAQQAGAHRRLLRSLMALVSG